MIEHLSTHKVDYTDELAFAIIMLEMMLGQSSDRFYKEVDFENGTMSVDLEKKVGDPFIVAAIKRCLSLKTKQGAIDDDFFSDDNLDFYAL